jgi:hypothetical protein
VRIYLLLASEKHLLENMLRILTKMKKSNSPYSISMPSEPSAGSFGPLKSVSKPARDLKPEATLKLTAPEIIAAQELLARIAARLMAEEMKTSEK